MGGQSLIIPAAALLAIGLLVCFFGHRVFRALLMLSFGLMFALMGYILFSGQGALSMAGAVIGFIIGGGVGYVIYLFQVFIAGVILGTIVALLFVSLLPVDAAATQLSVGVAALAGGLLAIPFRKFVVVLSTAYSGAVMMGYGVVFLLPGRVQVSGADRLTSATVNLQPVESVLLLLGIAVVGLIGFVFQYTTQERERARRKA